MLTLTPDIKAHFKNDDMAFAHIMQLDGDTFRNMNGRITKRIILGGHPYFIKQHHGVGGREIIKNYLQLKHPIVSARNEWLALQLLQECNILVPKVLGYGEKGRNPAKRRSFIILEAIEPAISLEALTNEWKNKAPEVAFKRTLIDAVADITANMHALGINHRDLYICHFLLKQNSKDGSLPLYLIDLHRAQIRDIVPLRWLAKDLAGLYFSSLHIGLTKRDRFRFMKRYARKTLRDTLTHDANLWDKVYFRGEKLNRGHQ